MSDEALRWVVQPDITALEIAQILSTVTNLKFDPIKFKALPTDAGRHFIMINKVTKEITVLASVEQPS